MAIEKRLTDRTVKSLSAGDKVYRLSDGGGLFIQVRPEGHKYWQYRYRHGGKEGLIQIGPYPQIGLEEARAVLGDMRRQVREGLNPITERRLRKVANAQAAETTFRAVGDDFLASRQSTWSPIHYKRNRGLLTRILYPAFGGLPIDKVAPIAVLQALQAAEARGIIESARRARALAEQVFSWAISNQLCTANPASSIRPALKRRPEVKHFTALDKADLSSLLQKLASDQVLDPTTRNALGLLLLTGLRDNELRAAKWSELDLDAGVWTIPATRMKRRQVHTVPLPPGAYPILAELHDLNFSGPESYVFASSASKRGHLAENTLRLALHRLGFQVTAHGIRSLLTDTLNELGFPSDWIERQMHHKEPNKIIAAYKRTDYFEHRVRMMEKWSDYCDSRLLGDDHARAAQKFSPTAFEPRMVAPTKGEFASAN